jgi:hypothetical protein
MLENFSRYDDSLRRNRIPMHEKGVCRIANDNQIIAHRLVPCVFGRCDSLDLTSSAGFQAVRIRVGTIG